MRRSSSYPTAPARQETLRTSNLALAARHILSATESMSRADLAAATGMTRSTASRLVDDLVEAGLIAEGEPQPSTGPGRPAVPLAAPHGTFVALGLEANVTHLAVRAIDLAGHVLSERVLMGDFAGSQPEAVLRKLGDLCVDVAGCDPVRSATLIGAGLALPGLVSQDILLRAPNLGWTNVRPADILSDYLPDMRLPLKVGNEANFGALTIGRTRPVMRGQWPSYIYLSGENGIGAGIVRDGVVMYGSSGFAGEIGHIQIDPAGPQCGCGNRGCVECYAGRKSILSAAGLSEDCSPRELLTRWETGSHEAREAIATAAHALGVALSAVVNVLDIPVVVLGGHLAPLANVLRPLILEELRQRVLASSWIDFAVHSSRDNLPATTGAAWALLDTIVDDPASWMPAQGDTQA